MSVISPLALSLHVFMRSSKLLITFSHICGPMCPITCSISAWSRRIARSFLAYTLDFTNPQKKKSQGVRLQDLDDHSLSPCKDITRSGNFSWSNANVSYEV